MAKIRPNLGGADIQLRDIQLRVVALQYYRTLSNLSACHVDRARINKEIVIEVLEDQLRDIVPEFEKVTLFGEE